MPRRRRVGHAGGGAGPDAGARIGSAGAEAMFAVAGPCSRPSTVLERDQAGYASANALMSVVTGMRAMPGRKSIVFFSEGLAIPPNVQERFMGVVDAANRANVSIYPMDAMGLRTERPPARRATR